jgi:hypothetical protein
MTIGGDYKAKGFSDDTLYRKYLVVHSLPAFNLSEDIQPVISGACFLFPNLRGI